MNQIEALKAQLLDAYVQKEMIDERIKALRNVLTGLQLAEAEKAKAEPKPE